MDLEVKDIASESSQASIAKKFKLNEAMLCNVMDVEPEVLIDHKKIDENSIGKSKFGFSGAWQYEIKNASSGDHGSSNSVAGSVDSVDHLKNEEELGRDADEEELGGDGDDYTDDGSDCCDNDDDLYEDDYLTIQSQFDNVDLPSGVEAPLPWLKGGNVTSSTGPSSSVDPLESKIKASIPDLAETESKAPATDPSVNKSQVVSSSSSTGSAESRSYGEVNDIEENGIVKKFKDFKQFDTVEDFSDHHYCRMGFSEQQPPKNWGKKIQEEWKILENNLPDTIYVRVYESRMELLRAVIVGPSGTPYHDGLFVFDCLFPPTYPDAPPMVYYYSGGLRLNPNLYECGKVCLSLLGTWSGKQNEMWIPGKSTMLQVLVSIQALILNAKPFFNEPGYETMYVGAEGERKSKKYNEDTFIMSLKTMMYTLRRPPKYFEDFVSGHFHIRANDILVACKAYADGVTVGSTVIKDGAVDNGTAERNASGEFQEAVREMIKVLITQFTRVGSVDCEQFQIDG